jgi:hypothetical protein
MSTEDNISNTTRFFTDIRDCLGGTMWGDLLPPNTHGQTVSFKFGEQIGSASKDGRIIYDERITIEQPLGIILEGEAELYESSWFDRKVVAYRPIRLMEREDIFGDFALVNTVLIPGRPSQLGGETWKLAAGKKCMLLLGGADPKKYPDNFELWKFFKGEFNETTELGITELETTVIAFVDLQELCRGTPLFIHLLETAWKRAQTYQLCVNSYNYQSFFSFRSKFLQLESLEAKAEQSRAYAAREARALPRQPEEAAPAPKGSTQKGQQNAQRKSFAPMFAEALFDAINRPIRGEPVFSNIDPGVQGSSKVYLQQLVQKLKTSEKLKINEPEILVSSNDYDKDFFFPLDLTNYFISVYALTHDEFARSNIPKLFGRRNSNHLNTTKGLVPSLRFYQKVIRSSLISKDMLPEGYPYTVHCVEKRVPLSYSLMLRFERIRVPEQ